jgi:hypothetical protein
MAALLIALAVVLFLLTIGLAFTIYGIIAAFLAVISFSAGVWVLARRTSGGATNT